MITFKPNLGKGDIGKTDLFLKRVKKTDKRIKIIGALDELNALLGLFRSKNKNKEIKEIQKDLISLSSFIAGYLKEKEVKNLTLNLEKKVKEKSKNFILKEFIIFGDDYASSFLNLIRTKVRICEIFAWEIKLKIIAIYLNRLSDYLFLMSVKK